MIDDQMTLKDIVDACNMQNEKAEDDAPMIPVGNSLLSYRSYAEAFYVPIVRPKTERLLLALVRSIAPKRILEIGTGIGYSTLQMHLASPASVIDTIEIDPALTNRAKELLERYYGAEKRDKQASHIHFFTGDATDPETALYAKAQRYDFVFLDAAKGQYMAMWEALQSHLADDAILFQDNVSYDVAGEHATRSRTRKRYATIEKRMEDYVRYQASIADEVLRFAMEDGILLSRMRRRDSRD